MNNILQTNGDSNFLTNSGANPDEKIENDLKNISPYMSTNLIAVAGFNVETPIVSAIIGNLTGTLPTKKNEIEMIKCEICGCELSSTVVFKLHINGSKHRKRLKALEIISQLKDAKDKGIHLGDSENPNAFRCEICLLTANSAQQLEIHLSGAKHKKKAARAGFKEYQSKISRNNFELNKSSAESAGSPPIKKQRRDESKLICCDICNVFVNSRTQYDQHVLSKRHLHKAKMQSNHLPHY